MGLVFYNAMLPGLAPASHIGRLSGWSWGLGYIGGLACLILLLFVFVQLQVVPFGLDKLAAEHIRIAGPIVAVWVLVFSLPLFFPTADTPRHLDGLKRPKTPEALRQMLVDRLPEERRFQIDVFILDVTRPE